MQHSGRDSAHSNYASRLAPPSSAREELFYASAPAAQGGGLVPANQEVMSNGQLMQQAVEQHKDTTATARRALQVRAASPHPCAGNCCGLPITQLCSQGSADMQPLLLGAVAAHAAVLLRHVRIALL